MVALNLSERMKDYEQAAHHPSRARVACNVLPGKSVLGPCRPAGRHLGTGECVLNYMVGGQPTAGKVRTLQKRVIKLVPVG